METLQPAKSNLEIIIGLIKWLYCKITIVIINTVYSPQNSNADLDIENIFQ